MQPCQSVRTRRRRKYWRSRRLESKLLRKVETFLLIDVLILCKALATPIYTLKLGLLIDYDLLQPYLKQENYYIYNNF